MTTTPDIHTSAGTILSIGGHTLTPSAETTWVEVGEVTDAGQFGRKFNVVKATTLRARGTKKVKGSYDDGQLAVKVLAQAGDPGQEAMAAALLTDFKYNFQIVENDNPGGTGGTATTSVFRATVTEWVKVIGGPDNFVEWQGTVEIDSGSIVTTEAVGGS